MFRKLFLGVMFAVCATAASSASTVVDTSGLSDAQIAELKAIVAKRVADVATQAAAPVSSTNITTGVALAATWGTQAAAAAEGFSKALGIAARELNVSINDFLKSPAGMLTAALIIWKMAGASLLHAFFGVVILSVGLTMVRTIYKRLFTKSFEPVAYSYFWGAFTGTKMIRVPKSFQDLHNDGEWLAFWVMIALTFATIGIAGAMF